MSDMNFTDPKCWLSDEFWRAWSINDGVERVPRPALDRALDRYVPSTGADMLRDHLPAVAEANEKRWKAMKALQQEIQDALSSAKTEFPDNDLLVHIADEDWESAKVALQELRAFAVAKCVERDLDGRDP